MRLGSLCTGYGGLDMAVSAHYGADLAWYSEVDKDCNQLLAHHWPGVPNLGDLTTIDWNRVDPVDVLCAGFPCQPFSTAGRRAPDPTDDRGLRPGFVEWMMGLPDGHVCALGLSRTAELKMLGNGVCPQQAALALTLLDD